MCIVDIGATLLGSYFIPFRQIRAFVTSRIQLIFGQIPHYKNRMFCFPPPWLFDNRNHKLSLSLLSLRLSRHRGSSQLKSNPRADFGGITRRGIDINLVCRIFLLLFMWQKCSFSTLLAPLITFLLLLYIYPGNDWIKTFPWHFWDSGLKSPFVFTI